MEATKRLTAEEERRLKLLEYLAAKGKLKPQNNCKPYLKDCTNLQSKKPHESSKQIWQTKKDATSKGSHFAFESNKNKTSYAGSLPHKPSLGKVPAQQTVTANRPGNRTFSRNPPPSKCGLPGERLGYGDKTGKPSSVPKTHAIKQERSEEADIALTVVLTKTQHGEKPEICVMDKTSTSRRSQHASGVQSKNRHEIISQSKKMPVTKTITQATKTSDAQTQPPAGKPLSVASSGHIRIVSRLSLPGAKSANERSFLIKNLRNDSSKQPLNVHKELMKSKAQVTCPSRHSTAASGTSTTTMAQKISSGPVPAPKTKPSTSRDSTAALGTSTTTMAQKKITTSPVPAPKTKMSTLRHSTAALGTTSTTMAQKKITTGPVSAPKTKPSTLRHSTAALGTTSTAMAQKMINTGPVPAPKTKPSTSRHSTAMLSASSTAMAQKKISTGLVSGPQTKKSNLGYASKQMSNSQNTYSLNNLTAPRKSTGPPGCNKVVGRWKDENTKQNRTRENKQQGVIGETKVTTSKASNLAATDTTCRPQTPSMTLEDRRKKLEEWTKSKGKTYKRPPMILPPKRPPTAKKPNPCNRSLWEGIEEEEELLSLANKISQTLSECLELIEKGIPGEDIHAALDKVPEAKKFAKYWVCKARLLEREGIYEVIDVYKQGVQFGATPIEELREVVFDIMKNTNKKTKVVTFGPLPAEEEEHDNNDNIPLTPFISRTEEVKSPGNGTGTCDQGSAVKLQVIALSSKKKIPGSGQEWKRLTPVRRSVRIHHSSSQYPEVVQEHDTVVSCLEELLDQADTDAYLYMRNEALPEGADHSILSLKKDPTEGQHEGPE